MMSLVTAWRGDQPVDGDGDHGRIETKITTVIHDVVKVFGRPLSQPARLGMGRRKGTAQHEPTATSAV